MLIKILCMNIHKGCGWYGRNQTLPFLAEHVKNTPLDLIFFQEIRDKNIDHLLIDEWKFNYSEHGNAIFSRFPIIFSENFDISAHRFEYRGLLYSIIQLSSEIKFHVICVHLGLFRKGREKQFQAIVEHIRTHIPNNEAIILAGDFNDWPAKATKPLVEELNLKEAFLNKHFSYAKTFPAWAPFLTLDRIYYRQFEVVAAERMIEKSWRKLSDHIGLYVTLEI
jgi:endonuclease/exonuclease/phosphatase family metal-dependent hydrolase